MKRGVVVVLSGFPRRSETFALGELEALSRAGALAAVFATKPGDGLVPHEDAARLAGHVTELPPGSAEKQAETIIRALGGRKPAAVHGYFAHHPAEVAEYVATRLGVPFGFSVHARDARKVTVEQLRARASRAACVVACNGDAQATLGALGAAPVLVPHGVNLTRFVPSPWRIGAPMRILAVGRLVQKKGFDVLLRALALVRTPWRLRVVGDGPEHATLRDLASRLGIAAGITWHGVASHEQLPAFYADADIVAVPSVVDDTGDRDGLPNVVLEALASARAVIATRVGAIASAVRDDETGWLVDAGDVIALASRIDRVAAQPECAARVAEAGRRFVERHFEGGACARRFVEALAARYV